MALGLDIWAVEEEIRRKEEAEGKPKKKENVEE
jgi:hypothetical protein